MRMIVKLRACLKLGERRSSAWWTASMERDTELRGSLPSTLRIHATFLGFADRFKPLPSNHEFSAGLATVVQLE